MIDAKFPEKNMNSQDPSGINLHCQDCHKKTKDGFKGQKCLVGSAISSFFINFVVENLLINPKL